MTPTLDKSDIRAELSILNDLSKLIIQEIINHKSGLELNSLYSLATTISDRLESLESRI